jgi:hypothetical protein
VRCTQGGGLTDAGRAARERGQLQAVDGFEGRQKSIGAAEAQRGADRKAEAGVERGPLVHGWSF